MLNAVSVERNDRRLERVTREAWTACSTLSASREMIGAKAEGNRLEQDSCSTLSASREMIGAKAEGNRLEQDSCSTLSASREMIGTAPTSPRNAPLRAQRCQRREK